MANTLVGQNIAQKTDVAQYEVIAGNVVFNTNSGYTWKIPYELPQGTEVYNHSISDKYAIFWFSQPNGVISALCCPCTI